MRFIFYKLLKIRYLLLIVPLVRSGSGCLYYQYYNHARFVHPGVKEFRVSQDVDDTNYPELASTAEMVASRIYYALGYFVPETYLIEITGANDSRYDGGRAVASRFVLGVISVLTLGLVKEKPYPAGEVIESKLLGYIALEFDPDRWRSETPNTAFDRMTEEDARWMAEKIARFSREQLQAIVKQADMSDTAEAQRAEAQRLVEALRARRGMILKRCLKQG